jgi:hypothetical protein
MTETKYLVYKLNGVFQKDKPKYHEISFKVLSEQEIYDKFHIEGYDYEIIFVSELEDLMSQKTNAELFIEAKQAKLTLVDSIYKETQKVILENQYIKFQIILLLQNTNKDLYDLSLFRNQLSDALQYGCALVKALDLLTYTLKSTIVPLEILKYINEKVNRVIDMTNITEGMSQLNSIMKDACILNISKATSLDGLNAINIPTFINIENIDIDVMCNAIYNDTNTSQSAKNWLDARKDINGKYDLFKIIS